MVLVPTDLGTLQVIARPTRHMNPLRNRLPPMSNCT